MDKEYELASYETREILFYKTDNGEVQEESIVSKMETTAADGKRYNTRYYNLDAIIAVGYRVNSKKATMFRIWANRVLKEFIIKGYVMDDDRLREPEKLLRNFVSCRTEHIRVTSTDLWQVLKKLMNK